MDILDEKPKTWPTAALEMHTVTSQFPAVTILSSPTVGLLPSPAAFGIDTLHA